MPAECLLPMALLRTPAWGRPTCVIPMYSCRRNPSSTLTCPHSMMQQHAQKTEQALALLQRLLKEWMLPFQQGLLFGSSIPPLCKATILPEIHLQCTHTACSWLAGQVSLHSDAFGQMCPPCRQKAELKLLRLAALSCSKCLCPAASRDSHNSWRHWWRRCQRWQAEQENLWWSQQGWGEARWSGQT